MPQIAHFKSKNEKAPYRGRGDTPPPPSHTLPPLGRYASSGLVASLHRKDCAPPPQKKMFWLITPLFSMQNFMDIRVNDFELDVYLIFPTSDLDKNDNHQPSSICDLIFDVCLSFKITSEL